ncbi:MAG: ATPase, T2SS/T4P/T4SS family [archaeon]
MPEMKPGSYEVQKEGDQTVIRFNWVGVPYSPSIEDDPETMSRVIDAILQVRDVDRIVVAEAYEYEYPPDQTKILVEIAETIDRLLRGENILSKAKKTIAGCDRCATERFAFVEDLLINKMRRDPIAAYMSVLRELKDADATIQSVKFDKCAACYENYINNVLDVIKSSLEQTQLIKAILPIIRQVRPGDRLAYSEVFSPTIMPNFTLTRYMIRPPSDGELIDQYTLLGDTDVEIYRIPRKTEKYYHIVPPEFKLPEDEYMVLGLARKVMLGYKPSTTRFTEHTRDYFQRVGEDLIGTVAGEQNIDLGYEKVKALSQILTRYTTGLGIMEILLADPKLQDIYINAPIGEMPIRVLHADWEECVTNLIPTREDAQAMAARFRLESGRPLDEAEPVLDTSITVPGGRARVCVIAKNLSPRGLAFCFRRHRSKPWTYPLFIANNMMNSLSAGLLWFIIDGGRTMLFAGPRSSGKTSMLSSTIVEIMKKYRILSVEDTLELPIDEYRALGFNVLSMKVQSVITKLEAEVPADEGIRTALRLGDSCLIIGEVRSTEAKALYEAMRVGALSNVVAGTIHGDTPYGVWDRVVNDLGVPTTSFKATDILIMPAPIRSADGMHRYRRVVTITEVGKNWTEDPLKEGGFTELFKYNAKTDSLEATKEFLNGDSEIVKAIASRVKEWSGNWETTLGNIQLRADIKQGIVDLAKKSKRPELLEAPFVGDANNMFHIFSSEVNRELGAFDSKEILKRWRDWSRDEVTGKNKKKATETVEWESGE